MFENSVVESRKRGVSSRRWSVLPISITLHLVVIGGAIFAAVWDVDLPATPPPQIQAYFLDPTPPSAPPPPLIRRGNPTPEKPQPATQPIPQEPVAPSTIPSDAPASDEPSGPGSPDGALDGDPDGDPNGVPGGVPGGVNIGQPLSVQTPDVPLPVGRDVKAPVTIHRVTPDYPRAAIAMKLKGTVTVECIIDVNGAVRDVWVVRSTHEVLNDAVVNAIRQWRFHPGTRNGDAVSTIFQLTVRFDLR
ncbi:MAG TPA: TonB family protein [Thermoanaerobaculia bacterium]